MIFVTVGTDGPFDRLVGAVDSWAGETGCTDVLAQIGNSSLQPRFIRHQRFLDPLEFGRCVGLASLVISHAGMGTILTALRHRKPLLVMPRRASLGEQRNEHQLATARRFLELGRISVAFDECELVGKLDGIQHLTASEPIGRYAQPELIAAIRDFILDPSTPHRKGVELL